MSPADGASNGADASKTSRFDPNFTNKVINGTGPKASPRIRKVAASLIRHLHDFSRENEVTVDELMATLELINEAGRISSPKRNEGLLIADILGVESLVDEITYTLADESADMPTATAILGPFWRKDAPKRKMGDTIVLNDLKDAEHALVHGRVVDFHSGKPISNAEIDVWHTAPNGLYESQDPDQPDMNLRGRFYTGEDGTYNFYCLRPTPYPIPMDGPAGKILTMLDRHPMRPAHIHFIVSADGYKPIVTQIFDRRDKYVQNDAVFAVKDSLVVDFVDRKGDSKAAYELGYDFRLASLKEAKKKGMAGATEVAP